MKILIAGSRSIESFQLEEYIPDEVELIISGGAKGVDTLAEQYADKHKISKLILRPDYKRYGKAAPLIRNKKMIELADTVIVIWDGESRGTKFTIDYAKSIGKEVIQINTNNKD
ncbi:MAG: DUF2493 domain-containing protein [Clostridia bacterium]|nr:DUF2493 domain-containing protein [Clostridia bacterium]